MGQGRTGRYLLADGPVQLRDWNPKGILRFTGRLCLDCGGEIMDHWLKPNDNPDLRYEYFCSKDGPTFSSGLRD